MYSYEAKKREKRVGIMLGITFIVAFGGAYFSQILLTHIFGREENDSVERLSNEVNISVKEEEKLVTKEDMLEEVMKSVVGISKLKANEDSLFDISMNQKWGLRNGNYCFRRRIYCN